ncbi:hypothetical protein HanLR1_Chr00c1807g0821241 [Helianthus annuus]|nr:hypothetical protein HanLR1_Chr00c1807g0821241 [Helianthus annuus]
MLAHLLLLDLRDYEFTHPGSPNVATEDISFNWIQDSFQSLEFFVQKGSSCLPCRSVICLSACIDILV